MDQPRTTVRHYMDRLCSTTTRPQWVLSCSCIVRSYSLRRCGAVDAVGRPPPVGVNQRSDCRDLLGTIPENVNTRRVPIQLVHVFCFKAKRQERKKNGERMEKKKNRRARNPKNAMHVSCIVGRCNVCRRRYIMVRWPGISFLWAGGRSLKFFRKKNVSILPVLLSIIILNRLYFEAKLLSSINIPSSSSRT